MKYNLSCVNTFDDKSYDVDIMFDSLAALEAYVLTSYGASFTSYVIIVVRD